MNRRRFLTASAATAALLSQRTIFANAQEAVAADEPTPYKLFFAQPAATWADSLPVGNGRLGACVFGDPSKERIQLNEESIWDGEVRDRNNPNAGAAVQKMREMLFAGDVAGAEALALTDFLAIPRFSGGLKKGPNKELKEALACEFGQKSGYQSGATKRRVRPALSSSTQKSGMPNFSKR